MSEEIVSLNFTKSELVVLKYLIAGTTNKHALLEQMSDNFIEQYESLSQALDVDVSNIDLQRALNHLSFLDGRYGAKSFILKLRKQNPNVFKELAEFVFLPAKKRKGYIFDKDTRSYIGDQVAESDVYIHSVIEHYFKLYAKSGSRQSRHRMHRWIKLPQVKKHKNLLMILAQSKKPHVQVDAITFADKSMLGFLVGVESDVAKFHLEQSMMNEDWYGDALVEQQESYLKKKNLRPLSGAEKKYFGEQSPSVYKIAQILKDIGR